MLHLDVECCKIHPRKSLRSPESGHCTARVCHQNHLIGMKSLLMAMVETREHVQNMGMERLNDLLRMPKKVAPPRLCMDQVGLRSPLRHGLGLCHPLRLGLENALIGMKSCDLG